MLTALAFPQAKNATGEIRDALRAKIGIPALAERHKVKTCMRFQRGRLLVNCEKFAEFVQSEIALDLAPT